MLGFPDAASETPKEFDQQIVNGADEYWTGRGTGNKTWQHFDCFGRIFRYSSQSVASDTLLLKVGVNFRKERNLQLSFCPSGNIQES